MRLLVVQFQPDLFGRISVAQLEEAMRAIAKRTQVSSFEAESGDDDGPYANFIFNSAHAAKVWQEVSALIKTDSVIGHALSQAAMVIFEGDNGWDDYYLLHHFDPEQALDTVADDVPDWNGPQ